MDGLAGDAPHLQQAGQPVGHVLGVAEGDGPLVLPVGDEGRDGVQLLLPAVQINAVLGDVRLGLLHRADGDLHRVPLVHPGDVHDLPADGGGKHAQVSAVLELVQDAGHVPHEAHVQHPVCLVQHHGLHLVQPDGAALHVIHEAARGGHHDLGLLFQGVDLPVDGGPAVEADGAYPLLELAQIPQLLLDLHRQLPGGGQHQALHVGALGVDVLHHGDAEGKGLARAGGGLGNDILPLHEIGDRPRLDGGGLDIALLFNGPHDGLGQPQLRVGFGPVHLLAVDFHSGTNILSFRFA